MKPAVGEPLHAMPLGAVGQVRGCEGVGQGGFGEGVDKGVHELHEIKGRCIGFCGHEIDLKGQ